MLRVGLATAILVGQPSCGAATSLPGLEATSDAGLDGPGLRADPAVLCSFQSGRVDAATDGVARCAPGEICGVEETLVGDQCCTPTGAYYECYP